MASTRRSLFFSLSPPPLSLSLPLLSLLSTKLGDKRCSSIHLSSSSSSSSSPSSPLKRNWHTVAQKEKEGNKKGFTNICFIYIQTLPNGGGERRGGEDLR
ncbi:hypothetical protein M432DRAFT_380238 [Thermoascus aurantiacus ATCC 26904]